MPGSTEERGLRGSQPGKGQEPLEKSVESQIDEHPRRAHHAELDEARIVAKPAIEQVFQLAQISKTELPGLEPFVDGDRHVDATSLTLHEHVEQQAEPRGVMFSRTGSQSDRRNANSPENASEVPRK